MKNTNKMLMMAACTLLLIMGTSVIPMQSYADRGDGDYKKDNDFKSKINASYEADKKSSSQKMDQDNLCYRGDDCEQANQGQQVAGKDNDANGFNDQSDNLALASSLTGAGSGTGNGTTPTPTPTPTPEPETCLECFDFYLTPEEITALVDTVFPSFENIGVVCDLLTDGSGNFLDESQFIEQLAAIGVDEIKAGDLIQCLKDKGVIFVP